ncbi:MAG: glucan biosynthesis protein G [Oceanicaulis sp.]
MTTPTRRTIVTTGLAALAAAAFAAPAARAQGAARRFAHDQVIEEARALSRTAFVNPAPLPEALASLGYDGYRAVRFRGERAVWANTASKFSLQMFAPGSIYQQPVDILIVESGEARPVVLSEDAFEAPSAQIAALIAEVGRFAGFRIHYPLNTPGYADEFVVFQGASYFRAASRGQLYGLSARGLAVDTGEPGGEEFPVFRKFWIERPSPSMTAIVVHALLDSRRVTGAYRFAIEPGAPTAMDVQAVVFPRERLSHVGLGCLTSMYMHGPLDAPSAPAAPDHRPAVHDSLGLAIHTGAGERLWRPLVNPRTLQMSAFVDRDPRGFGLIQRDRAFEDYQDLEARYDLRPSAWVAPQGKWGEGHVQLVEIPSDFEGNDNIVAYWRPAGGLAVGAEHRFAYRLTWPDDVAPGAGLGAVVRSAFGRRLTDRRAQLVIDWTNPRGSAIEDVTLEVSLSGGTGHETHVSPNPVIGGYRVHLTLGSDLPAVTEIRVRPFARGETIGETWLYRHLNRG